MFYDERPVWFECERSLLLGVVALPKRPVRLGVVIVAGGPQYRAGSHRQFVSLARALAAAGVPSLRFDYRGMGDSEGPKTEFDRSAADIRCAIETLCRSAAIPRVVLCGLCDAATASAFFPAGDARIAGLALFNPWVRTRSGQSEAVLKHYYRKRLLEYAFWRRLLSGRINVIEAASGLWRNAREASLRYDVNAGMSMEGSSLPERVAAGLLQYSVPILVVLSGNDLVAAEFRLAASQSRSLNDALQRRNVRQVQMPEADHTFSRTVWGVRAVGITLDWLRQEFADLLIETETAKSSTL